MKKVLLSHDSKMNMYLVPDDVADNLKKYCIDFRNMYTAIHGLIVFNTRKDAEDAYEFLKKNIRKLEVSETNDEGLTYDDVINNVLNSSTNFIDEINFRSIKEKQLYGRLQKVYDNDYIIVNFCSIDLYL